MAITQERMIATLSALRRTYDTHSFLRKQIRDLLTSLTSTSTLDEYRTALQTIQFISEQPVLSEDDFAHLIAEEQHFRAAFRKNQRTKEYARRRRQGLSAGISFSRGHAPSHISDLPQISDDEKAVHYENAERAIAAGFVAPDRFPELDGRKASTSPHSMAKQKPLDLLTTKKPLRSAGDELSVSDMQAKGWLTKLAADKLAQDAKRKAVNIGPIYLDYTDDSVPLTQDDQIDLGYLNSANINEELF
jgi:hypothetical protein